MTVPGPDELAGALAQYQPMDIPALPGRTNHIPASVLIGLVWGNDIDVLLTVRASSMRQHAGEVCFPGGTPDPGDASEVDTARREAHEELGIESAEVLGILSKMPVYTSDHRITPVVAKVPQQILHPNPSEVAEVLTISIGEVLQRPSIEGLPLTGSGMQGYSPVFHIGPHIMFGATAHSFMELLQLIAPLYGLACPPFATGKTQWSDVLPPKFLAGLERHSS